MSYSHIPASAEMPSSDSSRSDYIGWVGQLKNILPNGHGAYVIATLFAHFVDQSLHLGSWTALTTNQADYPEEISEQRAGWIAGIFSSSFDQNCPFSFCHDNGYIFIDPTTLSVAPTENFFNEFIAPTYCFQAI
jgi:hypothetical protein